jgi:hypothetical protein
LGSITSDALDRVRAQHLSDEAFSNIREISNLLVGEVGSLCHRIPNR